MLPIEHVTASQLQHGVLMTSPTTHRRLIDALTMPCVD